MVSLTQYEKVISEYALSLSDTKNKLEKQNTKVKKIQENLDDTTRKLTESMVRAEAAEKQIIFYMDQYEEQRKMIPLMISKEDHQKVLAVKEREIERQTIDILGTSERVQKLLDNLLQIAMARGYGPDITRMREVFRAELDMKD